ncbi:hypothetical protein [Litoribacter populi]|uniref:hypothetical protein n=1 Tax=Litoribacter populi TaxID=2598460 RepID=UPI00117EC53F|nr:hypothetical protein [Litoribacter populi]
MKKSIFNQKNICALLGVVMALMIVWSANAQGADLRVAEYGVSEEGPRYLKKDLRDELIVEDLELELEEEMPSVTFINKDGEIMAVLYGNKSVLEETYKDKFSKSYHLTTSGIHEFYLIKK